MYATKALEYLLLNPSERINYRAERGISIKQWYESFKPEPIQGRFISFQKVCDTLGLERSRFFKLKKQRFFGETKKIFKEKGKGYVKVSELNRIIEKESMLIPVSELLELIEKEKWYMKRGLFDKTFGKCYKNELDERKQYVNISNAARIVYELKKRKEKIENWPTLEDLNKESFELSEDSKYQHYGLMINGGKLKVIKIGRYDPKGNFLRGYQYKMPPEDYHRVLEIERNTKRALESGITTAKIAKIMGLKTNTIATKIRYGEKVGSLHPIRLCYDSEGFNGYKYALTFEEASLLIERKIKIPDRETLKKREQRRILFRNYNNIPPLNIQNVSKGIEWELWQKIRKSDNNAFNILLKLYEPLLNEVASNYVIPWTSQEERKNLLISALFEIVQEYSIRRTKRGDVINLATKKIKERWRKEEAPSWASLDAKLGPDGEDTFLNLLDNQHQLWLKTNSKARHSE